MSDILLSILFVIYGITMLIGMLTKIDYFIAIGICSFILAIIVIIVDDIFP